MYSGTIFVFVCLHIVTISLASTIIRRGADFCYDDSEGCGPDTDMWDPLCHTGTRQSPIDLPKRLKPCGVVPLDIHAYQGDYFRMQNNGHSIQIDFGGEGPSSEHLTFPKPKHENGKMKELDQYKFHGAHFHWGVTDNVEGSEHSVGGKFSAMELHLVHYLASYSSVGDALDSGDENALAVIGLLINVDTLGSSEDTLIPIVKNLDKVEIPDHDSWITVDEPLSLSSLLEAGGSHVYTYQGSLTTPECSEQVDWFVFRDQARVTHKDLAKFRSVVKDFHGRSLIENHRPLQDLNDRVIYLAEIGD